MFKNMRLVIFFWYVPQSRTMEHIKKNNKSHIFKHLHYITTFFDPYNSLCFKITDKTHLKIKEALHINLLLGKNLT